VAARSTPNHGREIGARWNSARALTQMDLPEGDEGHASGPAVVHLVPGDEQTGPLETSVEPRRCAGKIESHVSAVREPQQMDRASGRVRDKVSLDVEQERTQPLVRSERASLRLCSGG